MKQKSSILIMIHCAQYTGYAIKTLENVFEQSALQAGFSTEQIFWSFKTTSIPNSPKVIECDYLNPDMESLSNFIRHNNIQYVLAFDLGYPAPVIAIIKKAGVKKIISYWGASMSSLNKGLKLHLKKLEFLIRSNKPDCFIFESDAMRETATHGRGVPESKTHVVHLGVDTAKFTAKYNQDNYTRDMFNLSRDKKIIFYSGHMEERKGVQVIIKAALYLVENLAIRNIHFVICGNKNNEAEVYERMLQKSHAKEHVTFAGYRNDIPSLMRGSHIGVIASTGWDSFTMSSIEMMASGLPLIVSNLQGLSETIENEKTGFLITPGNHIDLAERILLLIKDESIANEFSIAARIRAVKEFSQESQITSLSKIICQK